MRLTHYILKNKTPVPEPNLAAWAHWFGTHDRCVKHTKIAETDISTVFLGLDHQFFDGPPLLFETMIFGGSFDQDQARCSTWAQAEKIHADMVYKVTALEPDPAEFSA